MLIDGNLIVNLSRTCAESQIDSVSTLTKKLTDEAFMASEAGKKLTRYLEDMLAIDKGLPKYN